MADFTGLSPRKISGLLQKLEKKKLIRKDIKRKHWDVELLPSAKSVLADLNLAEEDYEAIRLTGFSHEEMTTYRAAAQKIRENIAAYFSRTLRE